MLNCKWLFVFALAIASMIAACAPADASKSIARGEIQSGQIVPAEQLRVAEYLQYYKQNFPEPTNSTLGLNLRLGNPQVPVDGGTAWLQIGIQAKSSQPQDIAPLNLALVIDRSGSMNSPEKMPYLKKSLGVFLHSLASNDIVSIVAFSDEAELILPANPVGDGSWIERTIDRIQPGGSTNLDAGLMLGLQQVDRNFDVRRNNRVILLTDGIANVGVTEPAQIAAMAKAYNDRGIYLSTIGLGKDFNDPLLSQLATQGKGGYHFIDSAEEMDKVFREEVSGLMQKAASDVSIVLRPDESVAVNQLTGYDGRPPAGTIQVKLQDMGTGDSQVVLASLAVPGGWAGSRPIAAVELHYRDLFSQRDEVITQSIQASVTRLDGYDPVQDVQVLRNVTIQREAEGLKLIDRYYQAGRYQDAWDLAYQLEQDLRRVAGLTGEDQMYKDADMMRTYENTLAKWVEQQTGHAPAPDTGDYSHPQPTPARGRQFLPTPTVPVIEIH